MSLERELIAPPSVFPLERESVVDGLEWIHRTMPHPNAVFSVMEDLRSQEDTPLLTFIETMGFVRRNIQGRKKSEPQAYKIGALFMDRVIQNGARHKGSPTNTPSSEVITEHFFDLFDSEINHLELYARVASPAIMASTDESLLNFYRCFQRERNSIAAQQLAQSFREISDIKRGEFLHSEPVVQRALSKGSFLREYLPQTQGTVYGALDVYEIYKLQEWHQWWDRKNTVPVR